MKLREESRKQAELLAEQAEKRRIAEEKALEAEKTEDCSSGSRRKKAGRTQRN